MAVSDVTQADWQLPRGFPGALRGSDLGPQEWQAAGVRRQHAGKAQSHCLAAGLLPGSADSTLDWLVEGNLS